MAEESNHEFTQVPVFLPKLFVSPSCLPEFSNALEAVARKKAELCNETMELQKAMQKNNQAYKEQLSKCASLRLEIEYLESKACEMRKKLVHRIYVEVRSAKEMWAVKELWRGTGAGATPGMKCFQGTVYVSMNVRQDVINAIVEDFQTGGGGPMILFYKGYDFSVWACVVKGTFYRVGSPNSFYKIELGRSKIFGVSKV